MAAVCSKLHTLPIGDRARCLAILGVIKRDNLGFPDWEKK
jgi:hypothetical protein